MLQRVDLQRVALDHRQAAGVMGCDLFQGRDAPSVFFHRHDPARALHQQPARQATRAGADLQDIGPRQISRHPGDL